MNMGFCQKLVKYQLINLKLKKSRFFLILLDFPYFFLIIQLIWIADHYEKAATIRNQK